MGTINDLIKETDTNKFIVWKDYGNVVKVRPVFEQHEHAPLKRIKLLKVLFNKQYRNALRDCVNYAKWNASTYLGYGSADAIIGLDFIMKLEPDYYTSEDIHVNF